MDIVERLHHQLARALERGYPGAPERRPTIGDVYQHLIPYRAIRGELGIWELAEYEHALLRLLAGEGGHVAVDSEEARQELVRELAAPNPILGIYRDYAAVEVTVHGAVPPAPPHVPEPPLVPEPPHLLEPPPFEPAPRERPEAMRPAEPPLPPLEAAVAEAPFAATAPAACHACGSALPDAEGLRFCPRCGADQLDVRCRACDSRLEPAWNFCIRCGAARARAAR